MNRWIQLYATSPSGKTLFVCKMCGRISPTPDKECPQWPQVVSYKASMSCSLLEEIEQALIDADEAPAQEGLELHIHWDEENRSGTVQWAKFPGRGGVMKRANLVTLPGSVQVQRTPDGHINNCALANGDNEANCQICGGNCPDKGLF